MRQFPSPPNGFRGSGRNERIKATRRDAEKMRMHGAQSTPDSISTPLRGKAIFRRGYTTIALTLLPREALVKGGAPLSARAGIPPPPPCTDVGAHSGPACTTAGWLKASTVHYLADKQILMSKTVRPNCIMAFPRILRASNLSVPPPGYPYPHPTFTSRHSHP